jgi:hypothetical protein
VVLLLFALAARSGAAIPEDGIRVALLDMTVAQRLSDIRYDVPPSGWLLPRNFRMSKYELFAGGAPDSHIAKTISDRSQGAKEMCIAVGVSMPGKTTFSTLTATIQRLKRLAAENVPEGCQVEIVVFPIPDAAETGKPDAPKSD